MSNVLEFALGLNAADFLAKIGLSADEVLSFAGLAEVVRSAWDHTWEAIGKGAELKGLSSATGESVSQLYRLQHGLEAIGSHGDVWNIFRTTQQALSGLNEQGLRTDILIGKIGLNFTKLAKEDTAQAFLDITAAMSHLNSNQSTGAAEMLFGRGGAETALQVMRNMELFKREMNESSQTAGLLEKFASTFEEVKADWGDIQNDVLGVWVTIGGAIAPRLEQMFESIHEQIKNLGPALFTAIQDGQVGQLLELSLAAAFEQGGYFAERIFISLATGLGDATFAALKMAVEQVIPMWWNGIMHAGRILMDQGAIKTLEAKNAVDMFALDHERGNGALHREHRKELGADILKNDQAIKNLAQMIDSEMGEDAADFKKGIAKSIGALGDAMTSTINDVADSWNSTDGNAPHAALDRLKSFTKSLAQAAPAVSAASLGSFLATMNPGFLGGAMNLMGPNSSGPSAGASNMITPMENHSHPEFTSLEKMGFIMSGSKVQNPYDQLKVDLLGQIAKSVKDMAHPHDEWHANPINPSTGINRY